MSDLEALAALVDVLRAGGVANYEGPIPGTSQLLMAKLALRPPAPTAPAQKLPETQREPAPRIPAGLHGVV